MSDIRRWHSCALMAVAVSLACTPAHVRTMPEPLPASSLWEEPDNLAERDLYYGEWGPERAPDPNAIYTFVRWKAGGANPGMIVRDPSGREWSVKQAIHTDQGDEGPVEVVVSRVLAAVGYRQPPIYYLRAFTLRNSFGTRVVDGGRFRLRDNTIKERDPWSWQHNPFVGTPPFNGLLAVLLMFRSSDLKDANNSIYEVTRGDRVEHWYVVRDLGASLGQTGRFAPFRNNVAIFERERFILDAGGRFVQFDYHGFHQDLYRERLTRDDVRWAATLLNRLTPEQWSDAFRAGGYETAVSTRFIAKLRATIAEGLQMGGADVAAPERR